MKIRAVIFILITVLLSLFLFSCNGNEVTYYTVKFDTDGTVEIQNKAVPAGEKLSKPDDPKKDGFEFTGWFVGDTEWNFDEDTVSSDITLKAKFEKITYTVTYSIDGAETSLSVAFGEKLSRPEDPTKQYHDFIGWFNGEDLWNFDAYTVTGDIKLVAAWRQAPMFTVRFETDGGTSVSPQLVYRDMKVNSPAATTKQNYIFDGWYLGDRKWNFDTDKVTADIVLTAKWSPAPTFTVSFDSNGGTPVEPQHISVNGTAVQPAKITKAGHEFVGWYLGDDPWSFDTPITSAITLTAKWVVNGTLTVSFALDNIISIDPSYFANTQYLLYGEHVTEPDLPNISPSSVGYKFLGWYTGDRKWDFENDTVTADTVLYARIQKMHKVTVSLGKDANGNPFSEEYIYIADGDKLTKLETPKYPNDEYDTIWQFLGWYIAEDVEWDFGTAITEDVKIYAEWAPMLPIHPF